MNAKKKSSQKRNQRPAKVEPEVPPFDPRAMEKTLSDIGKLLSEHEFASVDEANAFLQKQLASGEPLAPSGATARTPVERAQDLMYEAWDATGEQRAKLARRALSISRDCADAYVLLAEEAAASFSEAKGLYEAGVRAGERALGPEAFVQGAGHFWGILETRPYMRARLGLAQCLWLMGKRQQAMDHYAEMLRLNPNDNQGVRHLLINHLLEEHADEAADQLLKQYKEDGTASWLYSRALLAFRQQGASRKANASVKQALKQNPFVPAYLLKRKQLPRNLPEYVGWGDEREAIGYAADAIHAWRKTEGALEWLEERSGV